MSTPVPYDQQYCPIARGLDLLGDRWTLLIVRELSAGPQRFSDLRRHLPGIAATVLSDRLRSMTDDGLVEVVDADPPGRHHRYALGPEGRRAVPVLASLVRFGMPLLEPLADDTFIRPSLTIRAAITAYHDRVAAAGVDERYEFHVDGEVFTVDARGVIVDDVAEPHLVITAPARVWIELRQQRADFDELVHDGIVTVRGEAEALARFRAIYRFANTDVVAR